MQLFDKWTFGKMLLYLLRISSWSQLACKDWNFKSSVLPQAEEKEAWSCIAETRTSLCCRVRPQHPILFLFPTSLVPHQFMKVTRKRTWLITWLPVSVFKFFTEHSSLCVVLLPENYIPVVCYLGRYKLIHQFCWSSHSTSTSRALPLSGRLGGQALGMVPLFLFN